MTQHFRKSSAANTLKCIFVWKQVKAEITLLFKCVWMWERINIFLHTTNLLPTTFKMWKISINEFTVVLANRDKLCGLKEKLLIMSNLSFCFNFYKSCLLQRRQKASICGKPLKQSVICLDNFFCFDIHDFLLQFSFI